MVRLWPRQLDKFNLVSKVGLRVGFLCGAVVAILSGIQLGLSWRKSATEAKAYAHQTIADFSQILAGHFRSEFARIQGGVSGLGALAVRRLEKFPRNKMTDGRSAPVLLEPELLEMDPVILDVAIWSRSRQASVFGMDEEPEQRYWLLNSKYASFSEDFQKQAQSAMGEERTLTRPVFQGHELIASSRGMLQKRGIALLAVPIVSSGESSIDSAAVAHIRLDYFQALLSKDVSVSTVLVDDFGSVLVHPDSKLINQMDPQSQPLFQKVHALKATSGQVDFEDSQGNRHLGGYSRIGIGQILLLTSLPESRVLAASEMLKNQWLFSLFMSFILSFGLGYVGALLWNRKESGDVVASDSDSNEEKKGRWTVNNGSQIVGPLTPQEIAARLFAQELDFDCECWAEGSGKSAQIGTAGIYTGSEDAEAFLWVFDGETIHGPMSEGFLKTAIGHQAMPLTAHICEKTTINGWKSLQEWHDALTSKENIPPTETNPQQKAA